MTRVMIDQNWISLSLSPLQDSRHLLSLRLPCEPAERLKFVSFLNDT